MSIQRSDIVSARGGYDFLFNVDMVNHLGKSNGGRDRTPYFVIFVVWIPLFVGGWVVAAWGKNLI